MEKLTQKIMLAAFKELDRLLKQEVTLIMGGGGAMVLAHGFPIGTYDIDAVPVHCDFAEIDPLAKKVAKKLGLSPDWLNAYFSTFAHTLPPDYEKRLIEVFRGPHLLVRALGKEDMLILKCFAGRQKDIPHARLLIKKGVDLTLVEAHMAALEKKKIPGVKNALDFLDDLQE